MLKHLSERIYEVFRVDGVKNNSQVTENLTVATQVEVNDLPVSVTNPLPVGYGDTAGVDAFQRLRVSYPVAVFENKNIHDRKRSQFEEPMDGAIIVHGAVTGGPFQVAETITGGTSGIIGTVTIVGAGTLSYFVNHNDFVDGETITGGTSGATATVTTHDTGSHVEHNRTQAAAILTVGDLADDYTIRQTHRYFPYVPGKSHEIWQTFSFGTSDAPLFVHRSSSSGSLVDVEIHQNDPLQSSDNVSTWNLDTLDGNGPSGVNIDWTKDQYLVTDMQWQGDGRVRMGIFYNGRIIYAHEFNFSNTLDNVYMSTPSLPIRSEIYNVDGSSIRRMHGYFDEENGLFIKHVSTDASRIIREICQAVVSMSGENPSGLGFTISNRVTPRTINNGARAPMLALRLKNVHPNGGKNRVTVELAGASFFPTTNSANFEITHIHDPSSITATWTDVGVGSACEYSTDISAITGNPSHTIDEGYAAAGAAGKGNIATEAKSKKNDQHRFLSQNFDSTNSQIFVLYGEAITGNAAGYGTISWTEFD
jgi:hypothetical protein